MEKVTAYKCSFCQDRQRRLFLPRSGCKKHEERCWLNPARKSCATCANLFEAAIDDGEYMEFQCSKNEAKPFKQKVEFCPYWELGEGVFGDEKPRNNRPIEREMGAINVE